MDMQKQTFESISVNGFAQNAQHLHGTTYNHYV